MQGADALTLRSYRTIDLYGAGTFGDASLARLTLLAAGIRGFDQEEGTATIRAGTVTLSNPSNVAQVAAPSVVSGDLAIDAGTVQLGSNAFSVSGYSDVEVSARGGMLGHGKGSFSTPGNLTITAPLITGARGSSQNVTAGGALLLEDAETRAKVVGGLGAGLNFTGASVAANTAIRLPSGQLSLRATAGDVAVGGDLNVAGTMKRFYDLTRYSDAGSITLTADAGDVQLLAGSSVSVAAAAGGNAGVVAVRAGQGTFSIDDATLLGDARAGFDSGSFLLDAGALPSFTDLATALNGGGFLNERNLRIRTGDVTIANPGEGVNQARTFVVSADSGDLRVTGTIDASGVTGGKIVLASGEDLILESGAILTAHAEQFSNAGKGGEIRLEAGAAINGVANLGATLDIRAGSTIDLGVDAFTVGSYTTPGSSAFEGKFTGTLHLRAPRTAANNDVRVEAIGGTIAGASSILVEGFNVVDLTGSGVITGWRSNFNALPTAGTTQRAVYDSATAFMTNYDAMATRLLGGAGPGLAASLVVAPGVEIVNRTGDLRIGSENSTAIGSAAQNSADWNLSDFRFGPKSAPGVLTLRASGNVVFLNALSDGFRADPAGTPGGLFLPAGTQPGQSLWLSPLMRVNEALPTNTQSWSFRIAAGADMGAADFHAVQPLDALAAESGSLHLGKFYASTLVSGSNAMTAAAINNRFQTIRTGTGSIDIAAGRDVQLRNQFATIYTAGVRLPEPTTIFAPGDFVRPVVERSGPTHPDQGSLGAVQQVYAPQWSLAGGDVSLAAHGDIARVTLLNGAVVIDSSRQLPTNWLYRRGFTDPSTGLVGVGGVDGSTPNDVIRRVTDPAASTAWWIDFSNFFQGIGALGGGNVSLAAGRDIVNADAVLPTNARMPGLDPTTGNPVAPDADKLVQLGGGDLSVRAGNDISGGIYYVERGRGTLFAGGDITTNSSRSPSFGILGSTSLDPALVESTDPAVLDSRTWLPTTLFAGATQFSVSARGDVLLGPTANAFLLPQGLNNKFWYKTYLNTFSADASVAVASFGGSVTHRLAVTIPQKGTVPTLQAWLDEQMQLTAGNASNFQPWIRLAELNPGTFNRVVTVSAPTLRSTAFAGDIHIAGPLSLFPSPTGTLELAASGGVIGLQPTGRTENGATNAVVTSWTTATINVSDASPLATPGIASPLAYQSLVGRSVQGLRDGQVDPFESVNVIFNETGSYTGEAGSIEVKQALHAATPLHAGDAEPVRVYAGGGDITGLTLFSPKAAQIVASNDITDVAFYLQHVSGEDISIVSAGRDVIPNNENAPIRSVASDLTRGNIVSDPLRSTATGVSTNVLAGDIQIGGPGVLEVLAGRNLDLGSGPNFDDGTGVGITSIGNFRNPALPFAGASIIALAGVPGRDGKGAALGLSGSSLDFESFLAAYAAEGSSASTYMEMLDGGDGFESLTQEQQAIVGMELFFSTLRDAGRNFATEGNYDSGYAAIDTLFGTEAREGEIFSRARDIRTSTGGTLSIGAAGGGLTMASDIFGNPLTPPGVVTEYGGGISLFTRGDVDIGQARIFTLRGGDLLIWSSEGDIAAGTAPKTVVTAPPTRVVIDATSGDVQTDLGGLATGGGIGVLASVEGVAPGNVDLIAPQGVVDAGDAGIRATGNLSIAAVTVLNASNISVSGSSAGVPSTPSVVAPSLGALGATNAAASTQNAATNAATQQARPDTQPKEEPPSIITVEVLGFGGGEGASAGAATTVTEDEEEKKRQREAAEQNAPALAPQP